MKMVNQYWRGKSTEGGKSSHKSVDIATTPMKIVASAVTPNKKQCNKRDQDAPKKSRSNMKKGLAAYFGAGKSVLAPSKEGNPISTVVQRCDSQSKEAIALSGTKVESNKEEGGEGDKDEAARLQPKATRKAKSLRKESASKGTPGNKKPSSNDKESKGGESQRGMKDPREKGGDGGFAVKLESMSALVKKKGSQTKETKKKVTMQKNLGSTVKTKGRKKKATFAEPEAEVKKQEEEEVAACNRCIVGSIRVEKGNNTK